MIFRVTVLAFISFSGWAQIDQWKNVYTEAAWKERDAWQRPNELLEYLQISKGSSVADVGSHEGYLTFKLSEKVGGSGTVYAVDVDALKLEKLKQHAATRNARNIQTIKGEYNNPKLPTGLNAVVILDTYHEMNDHDEILQHIKTALKTGGRLVLCEPIAEERKNSTRSVQEGKHELGINFAVEDLKRAGFRIVLQQEAFVDRTKIKGDKMWLLVAVKP